MQQSSSSPRGNGNKKDENPQLSASKQDILSAVRQAASETQTVILTFVLLTAIAFNAGCAIVLVYIPSAVATLAGSLLLPIVVAQEQSKASWSNTLRGISTMALLSLYVAVTIIMGGSLVINLTVN